jgi:hypothetical protein
MKKLLCSVLLCLLAVVASSKAEGVKVSIEISNLTYQVRISPGTNTVEYDKGSFQPGSPGLCPAGAFAYLLDKRGAYLGSGPQKEYSSAAMSSHISFHPDYAPLSETTDFVSGPHNISEILFGINLQRGYTEAIRKIKLGFRATLRVNGVETNCVAESDWLPNTDKILKPFTEHLY